MTIEELREHLKRLATKPDREAAHQEADEYLLMYIDDDEVYDLWRSQRMWTA